MKRIYLIDVSSLFFRAFYAIRPLSSPKGVPVNAIYGFLSMLLKLMKEEKPDSVVFCYDRKEPSFRKDLYSDYKANRTEMPEDLVPQIPYIKQIAEDLGIPSLEVAGFEADDLIGTLALEGRKKGYEIYIVSGDKDFAQLLRPHIWIFDTMKNLKIGPKEAVEKWGVRPDQMIDYLALVGDSSDHIPGVKGIGPKGAQKLLEQFQTLDGIYEHLDEIKGSTHEKLKTDRDMAYLSKKLVTIVTDVPISENFDDYHLRPAKQEKTRELLAELNFKGFEKSLGDLPNWKGSVSASSPAVTANVSSAPRENLFSDLHEVDAGQLSNEIQNQDLVWGFSHDLGCFLAQEKTRKIFWLKDDLQKMGSILDEKQVQWKGFQLKSLWHHFHLKNPKASWDGVLASYVIKAGDSNDWSVAYSRLMNEPPSSAPSPAEKLQELMNFQNRANEVLGPNEKIFREIEMPLLPVLYRMERRGIRLDTSLLKEQSEELEAEIKDLERNVHREAGEEFNVASPKQLAVILFEKLKLPAGKKTKTGYSTDTDVLEKLKSQHPIAELVLKYRELAKLKSTYVDALPTLVKSDGRLHTTFQQALTATGRLSSVDPNLQNIPIRTERGARVRKAFVAAPDCALMSVDYSQIELRILAHYSGDKGLIQAFENDLDIHAATASEIFGVDLHSVTSDQRRTAKAVNFGLAYGQGAFGLAEVLGISRSESQKIIARYFERFPGVKSYIEDTVKIASEKGFVETLSGRRRYMDELKSENAMLRKFGERAAINAPIQGTAADLVKMAMIQVDQEAKSPLLLQVHDELIFEGPEDQLKDEAPAIIQVMESVMKLRVPLKVNWAVGSNWDEAHG